MSLFFSLLVEILHKPIATSSKSSRREIDSLRPPKPSRRPDDDDMTKQHPGEFSREIGKWERSVYADLRQ